MRLVTARREEMKSMKVNINSGVRQQLFLVATLATVLLLGVSSRADVTPIGPFTGTMSESWESFNDYLTGPRHLAVTTSIMGGGAVISSPFMSVYLTNSDTSFGLGDSGNAQVADGSKGMGLGGFAQTATITFVNPVVDFGAYWGANTSLTPATISMVFSDGSVESFSYSAPHDGTLDWHGWHFTTGITSISYSGDFVAVDGLQAIPVPEPATALLSTLGVGLLLLHRRRYAEQKR